VSTEAQAVVEHRAHHARGYLATRVVEENRSPLSYGPPWAHYLGGYQDRLLGGPLGLLDLGHTAPDGMGRKDYGGGVLG
jgi:hypothetical protein